MKLKLVAAICLLFIACHSKAQEKCGTDQLLRNFFEQTTNAAQIFQQNRNVIAEYLNSNSRSDRQMVVTIPVVFHVIHSGQNEGVGLNISLAQIQSQIEVLNECYRLRNADTTEIPSWFQGRQADAMVEFCLAQFDTAGNPTSGVTRHQIANTTNFDTNIKPVTQWDPSKYLNIWTTNLGTTLLGYATPPGMFPWNQDGVVLDYRHVGKAPANPFASSHDLGRTCVHEVGHWLNLFHVFQDSCAGMNSQTCSMAGDFICDTPPASAATFGSPNATQNTCHETPVDENDMWMNYMDYPDDDQVHLFTHDQVAVMRATLATSRLSIQSSLGCTNEFNIFSFTGQVTDAGTGAGVSNAKVLFDGQTDFETVADGAGNFTIPNLIDGYYDVYAGKWGYMTSQFAVHTAFSSGSPAITIPIESNHYYDDFIFDNQWSKSSGSSGGFWVRDVPVGTFWQSSPANPEQDAINDYGLKCFVTGNTGGVATTDDVDNGTVTLVSPPFDLSGYSDPYLRYQRWFFDGSQSSNSSDDFMTIKLNNGSSTVVLETITPANAPTNLWTNAVFRIKDYATLTNNMRLIVEVSDASASNPNIVEGGLDKFEIKEGLFSSLNAIHNGIVRFAVYPNPSSGLMQLLYQLSELQPLTVKVTTVLGEEIEKQQLTPSQHNGNMILNLNAMPAGIYFITLQSEHSEKTLKISLLH